MELAGQLLSKHHGWVGHLARMSSNHLVAQLSRTATIEDWKISQAVGMTYDKCTKTGWRHAKKGTFFALGVTDCEHYER